MHELRSVIEEWTALDPKDLTTLDLSAEIAEAVQAIQFLDSVAEGWIRNLVGRGGFHELSQCLGEGESVPPGF